MRSAFQRVTSPAVGDGDHRIDVPFVLLLSAYLGYALVYIYRTSLVIDGERYFTLLDDAMVSMRYARNLVEHHGLVFNSGDAPVEGYTNPLWVVYMALFHLFPIAKAKISLCLQVTGAVLGLVNLVLVKKLAETMFGGARLSALIAVTLTAFYLPLNTWNLQGMEVSLLTCILTAATLMLVDSLRNGSVSPRLYLLLGAATLVRIDMIVPTLAILSFLWFVQPEHRRTNLRYALLIVLPILLAQTAFRLWYFGDWLPNTYYLKMTGYPILLRIARGLIVYVKFVLNMFVVPFLVPFAVLYFRRTKEVFLLLWLFLTQSLYSIYVGGDVWDWWGGANRFISLAMPMFIVTLAYAVERTAAFSTRMLRGGLASSSSTLRLDAVVLTLAALLALNSIHGLRALGEWALVKPPLHRVDNANMIKRARLAVKITKPQAKIAVTWAGAIPYFSERYTVDLLGKSDARIAHEDATLTGRAEDFLPGHMKRDYAYSLGELKPDVVVQLYGSAAEAAEQLTAHYDVVPFGSLIFCLRRGSPWILRDRVPLLTRTTTIPGSGT